MGGKFVHRLGYGLAVVLFVLCVGVPIPAHAITEIQYQGTNSDLDGDDQVQGSTVPLGFTFNFYGTPFTDAYLSTNGAIMFDSPTDTYSNDALPSAQFATAILPFWDDLYTGPAKSIYYHTTGSAGSRKFIVQWTNTAFCCDLEAPMGTFQAILYEGSNKIQFQYRNLVDISRARGDEATIGIQKDSLTANMFSYNTESIVQGDAISFVPDGLGGYTDNGHADTYDPLYLYVAGLPTSFNLVAPSDSATNVSVTPTLSWTTSNLADEYQLVIAGDAAFSGIAFDGSVPAGTTTYFETTNPLVNSTTYYWRVIAKNDVGYTYSDIRSFTTTGTPNQAPDDVTDLGPTELVSSSSVDPTTLLKTPFTFTLNDADASNQVRYEFVIATGANPTSGVVVKYLSPLQAQGTGKFRYGQSAGSGTYTTGSASTLLDDGTLYHVFVRVLDDQGAASSWTDSIPSFLYDATPAEDEDGIVAAAEDAAPNSGDANSDGFPDSWQANVSSLVDPITNNYAVLETQGCDSNDTVGVTAEPSGSNADSYNYPAGLMNFTVTCSAPGATVTVTQYFYGLHASNLVARKYNATTHAYTTIPGAVITQTTIGGEQAVKVVYNITDGGTFDQDGLANGVIVDPAGPAVLAATTGSGVGAPNTGLKRTSLLPFILSTFGGLLLAGTAIRKRTFM